MGVGDWEIKGNPGTWVEGRFRRSTAQYPNTRANGFRSHGIKGGNRKLSFVALLLVTSNINSETFRGVKRLLTTDDTMEKTEEK